MKYISSLIQHYLYTLIQLFTSPTKFGWDISASLDEKPVSYDSTGVKTSLVLSYFPMVSTIILRNSNVNELNETTRPIKSNNFTIL